jgi:hypothetical protein
VKQIDFSIVRLDDCKSIFSAAAPSSRPVKTR